MQIQVNYDEILRTSQMLISQADQYAQTIESLYARMHEMQAVWQGSDNQAFIDQMERFHPQLDKMRVLIEEYATYLKQSAMIYEQIQKDRIQQARKLL